MRVELHRKLLAITFVDPFFSAKQMEKKLKTHKIVEQVYDEMRKNFKTGG